MNKSTKKTLLIVSIIVFVLINISALVTIFYKGKVNERRAFDVNVQKEQIRQSGMYGYFRKELDLSDEQFDDFKEINRTYSFKAHDISKELNEARHSLINEISKSNPSSELIDSIAKEIGNLHYRLKLLTADHFIELKTICNEEQQIALQKLFVRMISNQDKDGERANKKRSNRRRNGNRNKRQHN